MNKDAPDTTSSEPTFGDARDEIVSRAKRGKHLSVTFTGSDYADPGSGPKDRFIILNFPNGRKFRSVPVLPREVELWRQTNFENWTFVGDYAAIFDRASKTIEAVIRPIKSYISPEVVTGLPGVERFDPSDGKVIIPEGFSGSLLASGLWRPSDRDWRLPLDSEDSPISMEISAPSMDLSVLTARWRMSDSWPSLKIRGMRSDQHDSLLDTLERYSAALFFELDLRFDLSLSLQRYSSREVSYRQGGERDYSDKSPVVLPRNNYATEAVSLYFYARSAMGMPLLQFLAFYQAVEFFFPVFWHAEVIRRVRNKIKDPRFNPDSDGELQRIISLASNSGKGSSSERQQLQTTLEACIDREALKEFIEAYPERKDFLTRKNSLKEVPAISFGSENFYDQVAQRVYAIRCRIVHSKEDGGVKGGDVLLPTGSEAEMLNHDIALIKFLAQKVIVAGSRGRL